MSLEFPLGNPCPYPYPKTFFFHSFKVSGLNIKVFSQFWVEKQNERYRSNFIFQHVEWFYSCKYFWWLCKKKKAAVELQRWHSCQVFAFQHKDQLHPQNRHLIQSGHGGKAKNIVICPLMSCSHMPMLIHTWVLQHTKMYRSVHAHTQTHNWVAVLFGCIAESFILSH